MCLHGLYKVMEQNSTSPRTMLPGVVNINRKRKEVDRKVAESKVGKYMIGLHDCYKILCYFEGSYASEGSVKEVSPCFSKMCYLDVQEEWKAFV